MGIIANIRHLLFDLYILVLHSYYEVYEWSHLKTNKSIEESRVVRVQQNNTYISLNSTSVNASEYTYMYIEE